MRQTGKLTLLALLAALAILISTACGGDNGEQSETPSPTSQVTAQEERSAGDTSARKITGESPAEGATTTSEDTSEDQNQDAQNQDAQNQDAQNQDAQNQDAASAGVSGDSGGTAAEAESPDRESASGETADSGGAVEQESASETDAGPTSAQPATPEEESASNGAASDDAASAGVAFVASPTARGGTSGAAQSIQDVRFGDHGSYERLVIDFGAGGGAASAPPEWVLSSPTGEGYSRIALPGVGSTAVSGGSIGGSIIDSYYVVRAPGGGLFVDIFATGAFQYRVMELQSLGRLAIDYRLAPVELTYSLPVRGERNVVTEPRIGEAISSPLIVSGYSRNFEASTTMRLLSPGGEVLAERTVLANDWAATWGYFEGALEFPAFEGEATLQVGSRSARDGTFQGVGVPVYYGGG